MVADIPTAIVCEASTWQRSEENFSTRVFGANCGRGFVAAVILDSLDLVIHWTEVLAVGTVSSCSLITAANFEYGEGKFEVPL